MIQERAICTIIAKNYAAFARTLARSFLSLHPDYKCYVLIVDEFAGYLDPAKECFEVVSLTDLNIPNLDSFCFKYNIKELCTAAKGHLLDYLIREKGIDRLIYLDPDILVTGSLDGIYAKLGTHDIVLTPHLDTDYPDDDLLPNDGSILAAGQFNLGFIGLNSTDNSRSFLNWWKAKLLKNCVVDLEKGYFVDQKFIDFVPLFFRNVLVEKDVGYNVAYWNLHSRTISGTKEAWRCNEGPLYFFHFSGYRPGSAEISSHTPNDFARYRLSNRPDLRELFAEYKALLIGNGYEEAISWPYTFGYFKDGQRLPDHLRLFYRRRRPEWESFGNPFDSERLNDEAARPGAYTPAEQVNAILNSRAWRWLSRYGRFKYRFLLPANELLRRTLGTRRGVSRQSGRPLLAVTEPDTRPSSLRLLVIADVGGEESRHIGDEAMLEANLEGFRRLTPEVAFTVVSREPAWAAERYGVEAVAPFGFSRESSAGAERLKMLDQVLADATRHAQGDAASDKTRATTIGAVDNADVIVVSGGGNLSSVWPDLLFERVALLQLAGLFGKPAILLGQTIGPQLKAAERRMLSQTLSSARFVGVRELPSGALALELGVPPERIWYQSDDALFLEGNPASVALPSPTQLRSGRQGIAITIDPQIRATGEKLFGALVSQLRQLSETTRAPLILVPHAFGNESENVPSDLTEAQLLAERLGLSNTVVAAGLTARQAKQVAGEAALIISSRYHPIVFGLGAGIASLGIYGDDYCRIKLQGALAHARLEQWTLSYDQIARGELLTMALDLWDDRDEVRRQLESYREVWAEESRDRWATLIHALDPKRTLPSVGGSTIFGRPLKEVSQSLVSAIEARHQAAENDRARTQKAQHYGRPRENGMGLRRFIRRRMSSLRRHSGAPRP